MAVPLPVDAHCPWTWPHVQASAKEKNELYRSLWGKEMALFGTLSADDAPQTLAAYFEADSLARPRVLRRLEVRSSRPP